MYVLRRPRGLPRAVEVRAAEGGEAEVAGPLSQVAAERVAPLRLVVVRIRGGGTESGLGLKDSNPFQSNFLKYLFKALFKK